MSKQLRRHIQKTLPVLALLGIAAGLTVPAHAEDKFAFGGMSPSCFTYSAVAMNPYNQSIQGDKYLLTHERAYHNNSATGLVLLYGPVQPWKDMYGDGVNFTATFKDPDGSADDAQVIAQLRHVGPGGIRIIETLDSNDHAFATDEAQTMIGGVPWSELNRDDGYYVVRIYINRKTTNVKPVAFGYNLCSAIW